jgi:putative ABC transport system permease protein
MPLFRKALSFLRNFLLSRRVESELDDEVRAHLELLIDENIRAGMPPAEARRAAQMELGGIEQVKEQVRDVKLGNWLQSVLADCTFAFRQLRKNPAFTVVAVLTLALGMGATTAIFTAVNPILFQSLPYPHANRLMAIWEIRDDGSRNAATFGMYTGVLPRQRSFESLALVRPWQPTLTGANQPARLEGQRVSSSYFHTLGISPMLGRDFTSPDDRPAAPNVVIVSDTLWRLRFGADHAIIGRQVTLEESESFAATNLYTVIGVMPPNFQNALAPGAQLWVPLQYDISQGRSWGHHLRMIGRLNQGVGPAQAAQELGALAHAVLIERHPETYGSDVRFSVAFLQDDLTRGVRPALLAILSAVFLLLIIACVNVTNLLLARGVSRQGEFALRSALGAESNRLIRQLLTESLLLAAMGGLVGFVVATLCVSALVALGPPDLPRLAAVSIDVRVFAFALLVTTMIGLIFGVTPALQAARSARHEGLRLDSRRIIGGHHHIRSALVVVEVALTLVLLVCSGLLLRSMQTLFAVPPGFNPSNLLTMQIEEVGHRYDADADRARFFSQVLDAVRRISGVESIALTSQLPLSGDHDRYGVSCERDHDPNRADEIFRYAVTPGYIETLGIPLRRGRLLNERDRAGSLPVALIGESFAKRKFADVDPIGQRIHIGHPDIWYTIVGVVGDVRQMSLALNVSDAVYVTTTQWHWVDTVMSLVVRTRGDAAALAPAVRAAVWSVDKDQPVVRVATMDHLLAASASERRFTLTLFEVFALASLLLAAAGIYGVLSGVVAERTREMGVRSALGASRASLISLVVGQGLTLAVAGVVMGSAGAAVASYLIASMLFGVSPLDTFTYVAVIALLIAVAAIACSVPAWRAARVDPVIALRYE